ncbi:MAG: hypothetical protein ACRDNY_04440 [Gaiellaceae bacterium]
MSRTARQQPQASVRVRKPSLLVWVVYALGILGAAVMVLSALFSAGGYFGSDNIALKVSPLAVVFWGGLIVVAGATWLWRRRRVRR